MHNTKAEKKTQKQGAKQRRKGRFRRSGGACSPGIPSSSSNAKTHIFFFFFFFFNASFNFLTLPSMTIHTTWLIFPGNTEKIERNHWAGRNGLPSYKQSFGAMNSFTYLGVFIKDIYEC
jgi:hypothetical protein